MPITQARFEALLSAGEDAFSGLQALCRLISEAHKTVREGASPNEALDGLLISADPGSLLRSPSKTPVTLIIERQHLNRVGRRNDRVAERRRRTRGGGQGRAEKEPLP